MKTKFLIPILLLGLFIAAAAPTCTTQQEQAWEQAILNLLPVIAEGAANIIAAVGLVKGKTVSATDVDAITAWQGRVKADVTSLQDIIVAVEKGTSTADKAKAAATILQADLNSLLPGLAIKDPNTLNTITALVNLAVSTMTEVISAIPQSATASAKMEARQRAAKLPTPESFKTSWNAIARSNPDFAEAVLK